MFGLVAASIRTYLRAPVFFLLLPAAQLVPGPLMRWTGVLASSSEPVRSAVETLLAELVFVLVQAPMLDQALRLLRGQPRAFGGLLRTTASRALPMLGLVFLQSIVVVLGSIALLVPGIIAYLMLFVAGPICVADRAGPLQSLSLSTDMTRGSRWRLFGAAFLVILPALLIVIAAGSLADTPAFLKADIAFDILGAFFGALLTILTAVAYDDLRKAQDQSRVSDVFL